MIAAKTARELGPLIVAYLAVMQAILVPAIVLWPDLHEAAKQLWPIVWATKSIKSELFRQIIGSATDYRSYFALQVFFKGANVCGAAAAILLGTGLIARERESHSFEFLVTRPIGRAAILRSKFAVAAVGLMAPVYLVAWSGIPLSRWLVGEAVPFGTTTLAATHSAVFLLTILALTTVCSTAFRVQAHAAAAAGGFVVLQTALYLIQTVRKYSFFALSDIEVYGPILAGRTSFGPLFLTYHVWLLLGAAVLYGVADQLLRRATP
ncbi:MAG: ABC transporter permease subunit [Planctomycetes bacterium]|nr:ABC transporter permease subunit [Planctomycetota bacterium]MCB9869378.1 ABC transporter permease subunit [Planctomycetota bacterium]MCB9888565.1 ABC transporter permease subunit [Planctomycetota bacterium]